MYVSINKKGAGTLNQPMIKLYSENNKYYLVKISDISTVELDLNTNFITLSLSNGKVILIRSTSESAIKQIWDYFDKIADTKGYDVQVDATIEYIHTPI